MTPIWLGLIGIALAHPVPSLLSRFRWPFLAPRSAIIMWQSLALAAILAVFGAGLSTALWLVTAGDTTPGRIGLHFAVLALTALVAGRLAWAVAKVGIETRARRQRHRDLVDLLGVHDGLMPDLRVIAEPVPLAYCLPAQQQSRVVVTQGTLERLSHEELEAVIEHERAHVRNRHDLVLEGFAVLHRAFPRGWIGADRPLEHSRILVELLADDAARAKVGRAPLASALVMLSHSPPPEGALGAGRAGLERLARLERYTPGSRLAAGACLTIAAVTLIAPTVFLAIPWIADAWNHLA